MHSPPRIRPKEYVQTLSLKKQRIFDIFCARAARTHAKKRSVRFPEGRPAPHKAEPGAQSAGPAQKTGPETSGPVRAARAPGCGEKSAKRAGRPGGLPCPFETGDAPKFYGGTAVFLRAPALRRPFAFVPARAAYSVGHAPAVCASTSSACPAAASLAAGWVFTWLAGC